jgi:hypothetical protein
LVAVPGSIQRARPAKVALHLHTSRRANALSGLANLVCECDLGHCHSFYGFDQLNLNCWDALRDQGVEESYSIGGMEFAVGGPPHGLQLKGGHLAPFVRIC